MRIQPTRDKRTQRRQDGLNDGLYCRDNRARGRLNRRPRRAPIPLDQRQRHRDDALNQRQRHGDYVANDRPCRGQRQLDLRSVLRDSYANGVDFRHHDRLNQLDGRRHDAGHRLPGCAQPLLNGCPMHLEPSPDHVKRGANHRLDGRPDVGNEHAQGIKHGSNRCYDRLEHRQPCTQAIQRNQARRKRRRQRGQRQHHQPDGRNQRPDHANDETNRHCERTSHGQHGRNGYRRL